MEITEIRRTKRGRISIYIDGEFACVLHPEVYLTAGLRAGGTVTSQQLGSAARDSQEKFARERALSLLSQRPYSANGLQKKLLEKIDDEDIASATVLRMQELGLIDDRDYAKRFAADCINLKNYSLSRTAQALRQKGIDRELADTVIAELEYEPEPVIARLIIRKYLRYLNDEKGLRKTITALQRLGYRYGDIKTVLDNLTEDENYYNYE